MMTHGGAFAVMRAVCRRRIVFRDETVSACWDQRTAILNKKSLENYFERRDYEAVRVTINLDKTPRCLKHDGLFGTEVG
jgi:tRNA(His) 5'-end guanylyltransferase